MIVISSSIIFAIRKMAITKCRFCSRIVAITIVMAVGFCGTKSGDPEERGGWL